MKNKKLKVHSFIILEVPEGTKKFMENFREDRWPVGQDLNLDHPEHEAEFYSLNSNIQY
jgi:hypothetical protein